MRAFAAILLLLALLPVSAAAPPPNAVERVYDATGQLLEERGLVAGSDAIAYVRTYHLASGGSALTTNDCTSTAYRAAGWRWNAPYTVHAAAYASEIAASLATWDDATGASLVGGVVADRAGAAGTYDGVNQIDWVPLGSSSTIAVTTTWYDRFTGLAVESDGQYNTDFTWSTTGASNAMDVQDIATHETGHTFGLDHPKGKGIGCLTMYAYANYGETMKRTLGAGDERGIHAIYGA